MTQREEGQLERTRDYRYDLRQRLNRAVRWLREAEDIARIEMPAWPTADRIRDIYEQVSEDVLNGRTSVPPLLQRLREAEAENQRLRDALYSAHEFIESVTAWNGQLDDRTETLAALDDLLAGGKRTTSKPNPNESKELDQ